MSLDRGNAGQHLNAGTQHCSNIQIRASGAQTITEKVSTATEAASLEAANFKEKTHTHTHPVPCECHISSSSQEIPVSCGLEFCFSH